MAVASPTLIGALTSSLANPAHGWVVQAVSENASVEPQPEGAVLNVLTRIVSLLSRYLDMQLVYVARLVPGFENAQVMVDGVAFDTDDAALFATIDAAAATHFASRDAALAQRLTPPAGSIFPVGIAPTVAFGQPTVG
jgi:hypothetical protein